MALLEVNNLQTSFFTPAGEVKAVNGVSFNLDRGKVLGIVGESGSGKSVTAYSIMQILASTGKIVGGSIKLDGQELVNAGEKVMQEVRGNKVSIIFQDPMTSLNPTYTIGKQLMEAILLHITSDEKQARQIAIDTLRAVGIANPEQRVDEYPHQLSGGMRQRAMIAMALASKPAILIADEPTTALDVTIQAQVLDLINDLKRENNTAVIFITHDMGVIAEMSDDVAVMYLGKVVEAADVDTLFYNPMHPYTKGLLKSIPTADKQHKGRFDCISGTVPYAMNLPVQCGFCDRCEEAIPGVCDKGYPPNVEVEPGHFVRCFKFADKGTEGK
ncbi:MAG: ABC transporter ATP-binding protein [Ruminiclostridium sp.]|nr:ABC transporter ATP-binding protein [Ruminiclostridium sp.]